MPTPDDQRLTPAPTLLGASAYRVPRAAAPIGLWLDGNEGRGPKPDLLDALRREGPELVRRYPHPRILEEMLATAFGISPERVLVTAGADEALDRICRAMLAPGREIVLPTPTFEMLPRYAGLAGGAVVPLPWLRGPYPRAEVLSRVNAKTALIAVVSPNNPTGAVAAPDDLAALATAAPHTLIVADLAYAEFAREDLTAAALALPNVVVTRTFSKAWGLAGLRVGYALGSERVISWLRAAGGPYSVASTSLALAARRFETGEAEMRRYVARVAEERAGLRALFDELSIESFPSEANFVLARVKNPFWLRDALAGFGIAVRAFPEKPELEGCVRVTCPGSESDMERLAIALRSIHAPEALLFDMDGVLADVSGSYRRAIEDTAASFGVTLAQNDISAAKALGNANDDWELTFQLVRRHGVETTLEEVTCRFEALYQGSGSKAGLHATERLIPSRALLERLAAKRPLAVVTGRPRADAERFLAEQGVAGCFSVLVCMGDAPSKPDPGPVRLALERLGVTRAWMIGDVPDDIRAARAAGVLPIGVSAPGEASPAVRDAMTRAGAARVLERIDQLEELLP